MLNYIKHQLRALFRASLVEQELDEELCLHLEREIERNARAGLSAEEARRAAIRDFGGIEQIKEECRDARRDVRFIEDLWRDLCYGGRMLAKQPGFTAVIVITLALGIGANTAVFSLVNTFLITNLPVKEPQELVFVHRTLQKGGTADDFSYAAIEEFRDRSHSFSGIFAYEHTRISVVADGEPEMLWGDFVSGSYFDILGVNTILGRPFTSDDDQPGQQPVAVISFSYWEPRFASDKSVIGRTLYIGKIPFVIIGVTSPEFRGLNPTGDLPDIFLPMSMQPKLALGDHDTFKVMARLKPGVNTEQARGELDVIYQDILAHEIITDRPLKGATQGLARKIEIKPGLRGLPGIRGVSRSTDRLLLALNILLIMVGVVLLITSLNVASLLLSRASRRQKEIAVRLALGATRGRIIRQLLIESVLVATVGGVVGVIFAMWAERILLTLLTQGRTPIPSSIDLNFGMLAFTGAVCLVTGILFGLAPALSATRVDINQILKGSVESKAVRKKGRSLQSLLVMSQVVLSLVLLIAAGLLIRSVWHLYQVDPGFERDRILIAGVYPTLIGYDHQKEIGLYKDLLDNISQIPGVQSVSLTRFSLTRRAGPVGPDFFRTMGIAILSGREFTNADTETSPKVAVISQAVAQKYFPNQDPIGQFMSEQALEQVDLETGSAVQVVGVVRDIKHGLRDSSDADAIYIPYTQASERLLGQVDLLVRTAGEPHSILPSLRERLGAVNKYLPLVGVKTQAEEVDSIVAEERSLATLLSLFGGLALILVSVGAYGVVSCGVESRIKELGIRYALGAQRRQIIWLVLRDSLSSVALGIVIGIPLALITVRLISSLLYGVEVADPLTIFFSILAILMATITGAYAPALRATRVMPIVALRHE